MIRPPGILAPGDLGTWSHHFASYIGSAPLDAFSGNNVHHRLNIGENMATLRNSAINILRAAGHLSIAAGLREVSYAPFPAHWTCSTWPDLHSAKITQTLNQACLVKQIRDYVNSWDEYANPFVWTRSAEEILAKVRLAQTNVKKLVNNGSN
ncbi:hypothetical protein [Streptomyces sp. NBC_01233]|uniref:hypothetical protein n=1 Tax=Streptomyces sp. NBC_01233 TaxID=2903787 RepID=UPI002E153509|nr:hypothetical protein OG332_36690 [Streptomyces sp. NBC_01233]